MNLELTRELLNEIEKKSFQMRAIVDGMASLGTTVCEKGDPTHICFTGTDPEKAFTDMASLAGELQQQIGENVTELFKNLPEC